MGRLRIILRRFKFMKMFILAGYLFFCVSLCTLPSAYGDVLIVADTPSYTTDGILTSKDGAAIPLGFGATVSIPKNGTKVLKRIGGYVCSGPCLSYFILPDGVEGVSVLRFNDGLTEEFFSVPALKQLESGEIPRIINDGEQKTFVVLLNRSETSGVVTLDVRDGSDASLALEDVLIPPGVTFYELKTRVTEGRLVVVQGFPQFPNQSPPKVDLYAFAAINPGFGAQRIEAMR